MISFEPLPPPVLKNVSSVTFLCIQGPSDTFRYFDCLRVTVYVEFLVNVLLLLESILLSQRWLLNFKKSLLP